MLKWICVGALAISILIIKRKMRGGYCLKKFMLKGKTIIITGANCGIGKATAEEFAMRQARVILACKNMKAANETVKFIIKKTNNSNVIAKYLDLSSFRSIKNFVDEIMQKEERLDILVNNAGVYGIPDIQLTEDFLETHMAVNHFGHFLLANLLLDILKASSPSRILIVSSGLSKFGTIKLHNLGPFTDTLSYSDVYNCNQAYNDSKLANNLFARELDRRLEGSGVSVYCMRPGLVRSNLDRHVNHSLLFKILIYPLVLLLCKNTKDGCQTILQCSIEPENCSGKFFADCVAEEWNVASQDMQIAAALWHESERIVGIKANI